MEALRSISDVLGDLGVMLLVGNGGINVRVGLDKSMASCL